MILATSWAEVVTTVATVAAAAAVPWGVYVYRAGVRRREREREDAVSAQARLVAVSVDPAYAIGTKVSPRLLGGLDAIRYTVVNDSDSPIRHVTVEIQIPWAPNHILSKTFDLVAAHSTAKATWDLGGAVLPLPKGQNQLGRDDIDATATFLDAGGLWWRIQRGSVHPVRLLAPTPGEAPPFKPIHVRGLSALRAWRAGSRSVPRTEDTT